MTTPKPRSFLKEIENVELTASNIDSPVTSKDSISSTNADDIFFEKENYAKQMKTPNELGSSTNCNNPLLRGLSFRKSLIFDTGLTPNDDNAPANKLSDLNDSSTANGDHPRAKTSLTFSEPLISAKSFYGSKNGTTSTSYVKKKEEASPSSHMSTQVRRSISKTLSKANKKIAARKMSGPTLWKHAGAIKKLRKHINKPVKKMSKSQWVKTALAEMNKQYPENDQNERKLVQSNTKGITSTETPEDLAIRRKQLERIQKSLQPRVQSTSNEHDSFEISDEEDDEDENKEQTAKAAAVNTNENHEQSSSSRKFFKSSVGNTTKKYRIISGISATLKRGCDLKLERPVKRMKKQKRHETVVLHNEITSIIDRLSSPQKCKLSNHVSHNEPSTSQLESINVLPMATDESIITGAVSNQPLEVDPFKKYRDMLPFETNEPTKMAQQRTILELLISNHICDEQTFKVFIAEPELHKEEAGKILSKLYCVSAMLPDDVEDGEWVTVADDAAPYDTLDNTSENLNSEYVEDVPMSPASQISNMTSSLAIG